MADNDRRSDIPDEPYGGADFGGEGPYRGRGPAGWSRNDEKVREAVCERLLEDRLIDAREVEVTVQDGVVRLEGEVPGASDVAHAEMLARATPGVTAVRNGLRYAPGRRRGDRPEGQETVRGQRTRWGRWVPPFTP